MTEPQNLRKAALRFLVPAVVIVALVWIGLSFIRHQAKHAEPHAETFKEGVILPDFSLTSFGKDQTTKKFSELGNRLTLVNFWATWCDACVEELPSIVAVRKTLKPKGFDVVLINVDENTDVLPDALREFGIDFTSYLDPENRLSELFDVRAIPLTVILDENRKVLLMEAGGQDWNSPEIRALFEQWLSGKSTT